MELQDVMKKIDDNGLGQAIHVRDLLLGAQNPEALNKIVDAKIGYMNATTDAERGMYAAEAKKTRAENGYQLSDDGSTDITSQMLSGKPTGYGAIKVGNVVSKNPQSGGASDAAFANYRATLEAAQRKAQEDALGKMSALTGGYASSSAATAATAAGADYSQLLAEKELELAEAERTRADAAAENEYQKQLEMAKLAASLGDYSKLKALGIDTTTAEKEQADTKANNELEKDLKLASLWAQYGDYSKLEALGIDVSKYMQNEETQKKFEEATLAASYGDFSKLRALGIDTSLYEKQYAGGNAPSGISGDINTYLKSHGATDFNSAYAMLLNKGYSSSDAKTMANSYIETYLKSGDGDDEDEDDPTLNENYTGIMQSMRNAVEIIQKVAPKNMFNTVYGYIKSGNITIDEGVELCLEQSNEAAYYVILDLLENGVITREKANSLAEKYNIEEPN